MINEKVFRVEWGDWEDPSDRPGHGLKMCEYIRTNAANADDLISAVNAGVELTGVELENWHQEPVVERLKQYYEIKDDDFYDIYHGDLIGFRGEDYFTLWRILALIGNPSLIIEKGHHDYECLFIEGYGFAELVGETGSGIVWFERYEDEFIPSQIQQEGEDTKIYEVEWGINYDSQRKIYKTFVRSNAQSKTDIEAAYRTGATIVGVDLQKLLSHWPYPPPHPVDTISVDEFEQIKQRVDQSDFEYDAIYEYSRKPAENGRVPIAPDLYFLLWRAIARVGNPELQLSVFHDETPFIDIGGYHAFGPGY